MPKFKIACHLIQWAGEEQKDLEKVLKEVADAGYDGVEGVTVKDPQDLVQKAELAAKYGLHIVNAGGAPTPIDYVKFNIALGNDAAEPTWLMRSEYGGNSPSAEDMARAAKTYGEILAYCAAHHVKCFHHIHINTILETQEDAERVIKVIPGLWLLFDTGHLQAAGSDPMKLLESVGNRVGHVHLKDFYADDPKTWKWDFKTSKFGETGRFCELGRGNGKMRDIKKVLKKLESLNYGGWIAIELDRVFFTKTPAEAAKVNRDFLRGLGY